MAAPGVRDAVAGTDQPGLPAGLPQRSWGVLPWICHSLLLLLLLLTHC